MMARSYNAHTYSITIDEHIYVFFLFGWAKGASELRRWNMTIIVDPYIQ